MRRPISPFFLFAFLSTLASAQQMGIPVTNWTVPPYRGGSSGGGLTTMTDFTPPRVFVAVSPCRIVDTRNAAGPYGGPALSMSVARTFDIDNGSCGIPAGVDAYSLNFGAILPPADGFLTSWPTGSAQPAISQLNFLAGEVVANAAIVAAGTGGAINVLVNIGPTNIYIDINGYFSDTVGAAANYLELHNNDPGFATAYFTNAATASNTSAVYGIAGPSFPRTAYGAAGVRGESIGEYGVLGISQQEGVSGSLVDAAGAEIAFGIIGFSQDAFRKRGVYGHSLASGTGIYGVAGSDPVLTAQGNGVAGVSTGPDQSGVAGYGQRGVIGEYFLPPNNFGALGILGYSSTTGVFAGGNYAGTGAKYFVEPHPTDASKVIRYIAMEGGEPGTYFRGRGRFQNGMARIAVPEDFRLVTAEEGLTVQVTPIGGMATVGVLRMDLSEIVVQSSRNFEFSYMVNGVRRTHKHLRAPIGEGREYMPKSADARIPGYLTEMQQQLLIQNGTYRADGTVNMETARRNGWDRIWAEREHPQPAASPQ
jgi:hypothetical protein